MEMLPGTCPQAEADHARARKSGSVRVKTVAPKKEGRLLIM
jgi:hypothetical protein